MSVARIQTPEPELDEAFAEIACLWPELTRSGQTVSTPLPGRYIAPGGFFEMFVYWDSYFTLLGLVVDGEWKLAREIVDNLIWEVEQFGHVPNYNGVKSTCRSRSQPPFLTAAIAELWPFVADRAWLSRATRAAALEYHGYWLAEPHITETGLSRYFDTGENGCGTHPDTEHHRAIAESGWDNTGRFGDDATEVVPVDLNCQLYRYEDDLAHFCELLGDTDEAARWRERAQERRGLIGDYFWDEASCFYWDFDLRTGQRLRDTPRSLSSYVPLCAGVADERQAAEMVERLPAFEFDHGLVACEEGWPDGTEHNFPTGWAYSHWYVTYGLRRYGYGAEATRIGMKWLRLVASKWRESGHFFERYNVVDPDGPTPGRYGPQRGFGWTNGVYTALLTRIILGLEFDPFTGERRWTPSLPEEWEHGDLRIHLPTYPWPDGFRLGV